MLIICLLLCSCAPRAEKEIVVSIPADDDYAYTGCDIAQAFPFLYANADGVSFFPVDALRKDPSLWELFHELIAESKEK